MKANRLWSLEGKGEDECCTYTAHLAMMSTGVARTSAEHTDMPKPPRQAQVNKASAELSSTIHPYEAKEIICHDTRLTSESFDILASIAGHLQYSLAVRSLHITRGSSLPDNWTGDVVCQGCCAGMLSLIDASS